VKQFLVAILALVTCVSVVCADYVWEYGEGRDCRVGGDIRVRLTSIDQDVDPNYDFGDDADDGRGDTTIDDATMDGQLQYLRVRERVYACFDITEETMIYMRLANRWQYYSQASWSPNNITDTRWNFPDEVFVDNLYVDKKSIAGTDWSLRLGRQDLLTDAGAPLVGNGMILLEGTPVDAGRSIYVDGAVATYATECDTVALLGLYNEYKDRFVFINDQNRELRDGDTLIVGVDWKHTFTETLNTELLVGYMGVDDDRGEDVDATGVSFQNRKLTVVSARAYGNLTDQVSYSVEAAKQFGEVGGDYAYTAAGPVTTASRTMDATGMMVDARLTLSAAEGTSMSPTLSFEYTYLSGDDVNSDDEYEGWDPMYAEYPIWREELMAWLTMVYGDGWTNLHQYLTQVKLKLRDAETYPVTLTGAWAVLACDETGSDINTGGGGKIGNLLFGFLDVGLTDAWSCAFETSFFMPGNFYADGSSSEWLRFQTVYKF